VYPHLLSTSKMFNIYIENVFKCVKKYYATMHAVQTTILVQSFRACKKRGRSKSVCEKSKNFKLQMLLHTPVICL